MRRSETSHASVTAVQHAPDASVYDSTHPIGSIDLSLYKNRLRLDSELLELCNQLA